MKYFIILLCLVAVAGIYFGPFVQGMDIPFWQNILTSMSVGVSLGLFVSIPIIFFERE